jgi:CheY-like chemotaxis protein
VGCDREETDGLMTNGLPLVLAVEDEESDAILLKRAFRMAKVLNPLTVVRDGQEAVDYLCGSGPYGDRHKHPMPALVLLDLKMPLMSGFDVLAWIATRPDLRSIPVVVLSSSFSEADMRKAREMGAREYLVKPNGLDQYAKIIQSWHSRWLNALQGLT